MEKVGLAVFFILLWGALFAGCKKVSREGFHENFLDYKNHKCGRQNSALHFYCNADNNRHLCKLVGNRIKYLSESGYLIAFSCNNTIKKICEPRENKRRRGVDIIDVIGFIRHHIEYYENRYQKHSEK